MDRGAWWATVHKVAKSGIRLSDCAHQEHSKLVIPFQLSGLLPVLWTTQTHALEPFYLLFLLSRRLLPPEPARLASLTTFSSESFYVLKVATTHDISPDIPNTLLHLTFELSSNYHLTELFFSILWDSFLFHEHSKFFLASFLYLLFPLLERAFW